MMRAVATFVITVTGVCGSLLKATEEGDLDKIIELCKDKKMDPNKQDEDGATPLFVAAKYGQDKIIAQLVALGADPNLRDQWQQTALHYAVVNGSVAVIKPLVESGANPNSPDEKGMMPIHLAAYYGRNSCVKPLIDSGANANLKVNESQGLCGSGQSAVDIAIQQGHPETARLLRTYEKSCIFM